MSDSQKMNKITNGFSIDLPEGWVWGKIGEIVEIKYGKGLIKENRKGGKFPVYGSNGIVGYHDQALTQGQTIIIGRKGSVGEVHYSQIACCPIDTTYYIDNFISVNSTYIFHLLRHSRLGELDKSTAIPGVNRDDIYSVTIPIPPLPEQRFIVAEIESLLDHVKKAKESLDRIPLIMKRFRQAALKKAFSGELTAEWREQQEYLEPAAELLKRIQEERECDYQTNVRQKKAKNLKKQEIELFDTSELTELPDEWVWCNLREITLQTSTKDPRREKDGSFYYIDIEAIDNAKQIINVPRKIENVNAPSRAKRIIKTGDVIFSLVRPYLKNIALIPTELDGQIASTAFYVLRPTKSLYPRFLFNGVRRQSFIDSIITYGDSPPSARDEEFTLLPFPLPPLPEQQEIVRRIDALFKFAYETEKNAAEARKRVEIMTQSLLARAFRGDLSAEFREAVRNWKDLDGEARGRYVFVLPEEEREKVIEADEFPMEEVSYLLKRVMEEKGKIERKKGSINKRSEKPNKHLLNDEIGNIVK